MNPLKSPKELRKEFYSQLLLAAENPDRSLISGEAFSRRRKIGLYNILLFTTALSSASVGQQVRTFFKTHGVAATESAFCQARSKYDHTIMKKASLKFAKELVEKSSLYKGKYRLIGVDGSNFPILPNPDEPQNLVPGHGDPHWAIHFNAAYDLMNRYYLDWLVQSATEKNENSAAASFVEHYDSPGVPVWIFDRLYFSYNLAVQIQERKQKFLFRMKLRDFIGLLEEGLSPFEPLDYETSRMLVNSLRSEISAFPDLYKYVAKGKVKQITEDNPELYFPYRIICVEVETLNDETGETTTELEYLITNLDADEFSTEEIKELYHLRWNIEISFRDLKYVVKAKQVHSRKQNLIEQEIDAAVMVFNLTSAISKCAAISNKGRKHEYRVNFKRLANVVRDFLDGRATQKEVIWTLGNAVEPIRKNRHFKRVSTTVLTSHWS